MVFSSDSFRSCSEHFCFGGGLTPIASIIVVDINISLPCIKARRSACSFEQVGICDGDTFRIFRVQNRIAFIVCRRLSSIVTSILSLTNSSGSRRHAKLCYAWERGLLIQALLYPGGMVENFGKLSGNLKAEVSEITTKTWLPCSHWVKHCGRTHVVFLFQKHSQNANRLLWHCPIQGEFFRNHSRYRPPPHQSTFYGSSGCVFGSFSVLPKK